MQSPVCSQLRCFVMFAQIVNYELYTYTSNMNEFRDHPIIQSWNIELQREWDTVYLHLGMVSGDGSVGWPVTNYSTSTTTLYIFLFIFNSIHVIRRLHSHHCCILTRAFRPAIALIPMHDQSSPSVNQIWLIPALLNIFYSGSLSESR